MIRLVLVDDHQIFRDGLRAIMAQESGLELVGEASDSGQLFDILQHQEVDVILLDLQLPGKDGLEICRELVIEYPQVKTLILSMHKEEEFITAALEAGAMGYMLKDAGKEALLEAINDVHLGQKYFSKGVTRILVDSMLNSTHKPSGPKPSKAVELSQRELEVLQLICKEYTTPQIAEELYISTHTVKSHRKSLNSKLNVSNVAGLIRFAMDNDLL